MSFDPRLARAFHQEQRTPNTCVAACVCMVEKRRGEPAKQAKIQADSLQTAAIVTGWQFRVVDWNNADERDLLFAQLALGTWLIVDVYPGPLTMHTERLPGSPVSRHGPLMERSSPVEDLRKRWPQAPLHAVVLVEEVVGGFRYLDPWLPKKGQPFFVGRADFADMWTGRVLVPR